MKKPFNDIAISGLISERCYAVEGAVLRIHLRLSDTPPLGWAYLFTQAWQVIEYPGKRPVGIEGDALWIECAPDEVRACHLSQLERALAGANARYRAQHQRKEVAAANQRELGRQTQAKLDALAMSFTPVQLQDSGQESQHRFSLGSLLQFLRRGVAALVKRNLA